MRDYTKIKAWQFADDLTVAVYERTRSFPREEVYGLTSQLRRASYSLPANIVEGALRESKRDYLRGSQWSRGIFRRRLEVGRSLCQRVRIK
jgi:four helix bundle protein